MTKTNNSWSELLRRCGMITLGAAIYALSYNAFYAPTNISYGGFTGVAQIIYELVGFPTVGTSVLLMNLPLYLVGWKLLGGKALVANLYGMVISSVFIDLIAMAYTFPTTDHLLSGIFGGLLQGVGLGIIIASGGSTGGSDLLARLLKFPVPWLPMGKLIMGIDLTVICLSGLVFRQLDTVLYGLIALYIAIVAIDTILYGLDKSKVAYIISEQPDAFVRAIDSQLERGATILHGAGGATGEEKKVVMCAFKQKQIVDLKRLAHDIDPNAFIIVCDAHDVLGNGFHFYQKNDL